VVNVRTCIAGEDTVVVAAAVLLAGVDNDCCCCCWCCILLVDVIVAGPEHRGRALPVSARVLRCTQRDMDAGDDMIVSRSDVLVKCCPGEGQKKKRKKKNEVCGI
jgi:hypothetical protein